MVKATLPPFYPLEMDQVPIVQGAGWAPGHLWENSVPPGVQPPDHLARSELLYRLSYSTSKGYCNDYKFLKCRFDNAIYWK